MDKRRCYVVPSAPGKRFDGDIKITDMLYQCYAAAEEGKDIKPLLEKIEARYQEIINGLEMNLSLKEEFAKIEELFMQKAGKEYAGFQRCRARSLSHPDPSGTSGSCRGIPESV